MLLDPLKEQFHLPASLIERADGGCRQDEIVGQEHQRLAGVGVFEADTTQMLGVVLAACDTGERNGLVTDDTCTAIYRSRVLDLVRVTKKVCA